MQKLNAILLTAGTMLVLCPTVALADFPSDVEGARMNALAGGPVSAHDAELVRRWGCLSGTRSRWCSGHPYRHRAYRGYR
jgi:hypothetical protein